MAYIPEVIGQQCRIMYKQSQNYPMIVHCVGIKQWPTIEANS